MDGSPTEFVDILKESQTFRPMPEPALSALAAIARRQHFDDGARIMVEGEQATDLFLILEGSVEVSIAVSGGFQMTVGRAEAGDVLGEGQLLKGGHRSASVQASGPVSLLHLPEELLKAVLTDHPSILHAIALQSRERLRHNQLRLALNTQYALANRAGQRASQLFQAIVEVVQWQTLRSQEVLVRQGETSDAIYFLLQGRLLAILENPDGTPARLLGEILPGRSVGQTVVLPGETRGATVIATRPSEVARLAQEDFNRIADEHPILLRHLLEEIVKMEAIGTTSHPPVLGAYTVALVPLKGTTTQQMRTLVEQLMRAAKPFEAAFINREQVKSRFGDPDLTEFETGDPNALRLSCWLEHIEAGHQLQVYEVDDLESQWAKRCVGTANEIVLVASAHGSAAPTRAEQRLLNKHYQADQTLLLLHAPSQAPKSTARWMKPRPHTQNVWHVCVDRPRDFERVIRLLTRTAVGLVLSGSGARGIAGLGVIRALNEAGVSIDAMGGVSMGGIIAAAYAVGIDESETLRALKHMTSLAFGLTVPVVSLNSGRSITKTLNALFGDKRIEDLWLPYLCISTNLTRATQHVATHGELRTHLLASNATPGLFPPVTIDGELHVEGSVLNNAPVAEVSQLVRGGPVITVDVTPVVEFEHNRPHGSGLTGTRMLIDWSRKRGHDSMPNIVEILTRAQLINHVKHLRSVQGLSSLYLDIPPDDRFGIMAYRSGQAIADAGYSHSRAAIGRWLSDQAQAPKRPLLSIVDRINFKLGVRRES